MITFAYSLDTARTNGRSTHDKALKKRRSGVDLTRNPSEQLILPDVQKQYDSLRQDCEAKVVRKLCKVLHISFTAQPITKSEEHEQGRCNVCLENIRGTKDFKRKRVKVYPRVKNKYTTCK